MTNWIPQVAVISPERQTILDLIRLCKREMVYHSRVIRLLQELSSTGQSALAIQLADRIKDYEEATGLTDADVLFRPVESALMRGEEFLQSLQAVLSKQL